MTRRSTPPLVPVKPAKWDRLAEHTAEHSLTEQRERRKSRRSVVYTGTFRHDTEVADIVTPLALAVSRLHNPLALRRDVDAVADAVGETVHTAAGLIGESTSTDDRTRRLAADLAVRPRQPVLTDQMLISGSWSTALTAYAAVVADDLTKVLDVAHRPESPALRGAPSASERIERALRLLDRAARELERRIDRVATQQSLPGIGDYNRQQRDLRDRDRVEREMARMGVT